MSDPTATEALAAKAEQAMRERLDALTDEQREQLSQALFPSTHTKKVTLLGKERTLRPLTVKYERQLHITLQSFQQKMVKGIDEDVIVDIDLLEVVLDAAKILCVFYDDWDDVKEAIEEEDCQLHELQALLVEQSALQAANSFLLMPLRVLVVVMQQAEIEMIHLQSTFSGLRSASIIDAPSTN